MWFVAQENVLLSEISSVPFSERVEEKKSGFNPTTYYYLCVCALAELYIFIVDF